MGGVIKMKNSAIDEDILKKSNKLDEKSSFVKKRYEIDEDIEIVSEKIDENGKERTVVKKRRRLDEERAIVKENSAIDEDTRKKSNELKKRYEIDEDIAIVSEKIDENGKERTVVKKRRRLDEERAIVKENSAIDEGIPKKSNKLDEKSSIGKKRYEIDEDIAIVSEKIDENGKERTIVKERRRLDEERAIVKKSDEIVEKNQNRIVGETCKILPEDLWVEDILTRLSGLTLARCSFVSKLWYKSIYKDKRFAALHYDRNENKSSLILNLLNVFRGGMDYVYFFNLEDKDKDPKYLTHLRAGNICELVGYCNGLTCVKQVSKPDDALGSIAVVNPFRSQTLTLSYVTPTGGYRYLCHGFGFDSLSQVYKAVIIFASKDNDGFLCMVVTLGTSSWRKITTTTSAISPPPGFSPFPSRMVTRVSRTFCRPATFCGGDLLWRTTSKVDDSKIEMLLSFDLHNEKIQFIRLPAESTLMNDRQYLVVDHLLEFKGYPCIARSEKSEKIMTSNSDHCGHICDYQGNFNCCCCCKVHMYILKDKVNQVWIREQTFDVQIKDREGLLPAPLCCYFDSSVVTPPTRILTLSDQVLLYWFNGECLILYNLLEKYLKVVKCSRSYPGIFRAKMNETLDRAIGDDNNIYCPYMDYQLHAQVENLVFMKTFIPKGAKTSKYDCIQDLQRAVKDNRPAGWLVLGRKSSNCYAFREDKEVDDEVSDIVEGQPKGSCRLKQLVIPENSNKGKSTGVVEKLLVTSLPVPIPVPIEEWMAVLFSVPDLDDILRLDAIDFLNGDSRCVCTFMALAPGLRKKWLIEKLRPV